MKQIIRIYSILLFFSCENTESGMRYGRILIAQKGDQKVYCYNLVWARDAELTFISKDENVCAGFDSSKDISFGRGLQTIYYAYSNDTLNLYTYGSKPILPSISGFNIKWTNLDLLSIDKYDDMVKKGQLTEAQFDSYVDVPCGPLSIVPIDDYNVKFKPK